jgi:hypothetical protein
MIIKINFQQGNLVIISVRATLLSENEGSGRPKSYRSYGSGSGTLVKTVLLIRNGFIEDQDPDPAF